jgi:hypothetical protein
MDYLQQLLKGRVLISVILQDNVCQRIVGIDFLVVEANRLLIYTDRLSASESKSTSVLSILFMPVPF